MAKRKGNGEGTISKLKSGLWMGRVSAGRDDEGKLLRKSLYGKTRIEVYEKMVALKNELLLGNYIANNVLLKQWLLKWLRDYKTINLKPRTYDTYETQIIHNIIPEIGEIPLVELKPEDIQRFYNKKYNYGNGLSASTIRKIHNILNAALDKAVENNLMKKNVAKNSELPRQTKPAIRAFTVEEQQKFFEVAKDYRLYDAYLLNVDTGLRAGELLAVTWNDVDLKKGTITVNKNIMYIKNRDKNASTKNKTIVQDSPKTEASNRTIYLTARSLGVLRAMDTGKTCDIVFPSRQKTHISLRTYQRTFYSILEKAGIEKCSPHVLRHTFVTRCFELNVPMKLVSKMVGHAKIAHTADIYTHIMPDMERNAVDALDKLYAV